MEAEALTDDIQQGLANFESVAMEGADADTVPEPEAKVEHDISELFPDGELSPDTILAAIEESAVQEAAEPDEPAEKQDVGEVPDSAEERGTGKRAQTRIRNLVKQRNELQSQMEQMQAQQQAFMQQQMQQQGGAVSEQLAEMRKQNEFLTNQMLVRQTAAEEEDLDPEQKFARDLIRKQEASLGTHIEKALQPYKQQLEELKRERREAIENQQMEKRLAGFTQQAKQAKDQVLFNDLLSEDAQELGGVGEEFILTAAAAFRQAPEEAAFEQKKFLDRYFKARLKAESAKRKTTMQKSKAAPSSQAQNRAPGRGTGLPKYTKQQVQKAGYDNYFDAAMKNFAGVTDD